MANCNGILLLSGFPNKTSGSFLIGELLNVKFFARIVIQKKYFKSMFEPSKAKQN